MSIQTSRKTTDSTDSEHTDDEDDDPEYRLPPKMAAQIRWLHDDSNIVTVEHEVITRRRRRRDNDTKTVTETMYVSPQYEEDTRACHNSQAGVCDAWEAQKFPSHNIDTVEGLTGAHLYTWSSSSQGRGRFGRFRGGSTESTINYQAVQHPNGHGVIQHYSTIAAVRTKTGLTLVNEQDFGGGFAHVTRPDEWDHELPLSGVQEILDDHSETIYDIVSVAADATKITPTTEKDPIGGHDVVTGFQESWNNDRQVRRVNLSSGAAVIVMHDSTANNPDEERCGYYMEAPQAELNSTAQYGLDALQPIDVKQARERGMDIVPCDQYAGNGAGGFYTESLLGDAIIRQGEWYLIPMAADWTPDAPIYKPRPVATRKSDWNLEHIDAPDRFEATNLDGVVDEIPSACPDCGHGHLNIDAEMPVATCDDCGYAVNYSEAHFAELAEKKLADWVSDEYGTLYEDATDTLGSHSPRDLAVTEDGIYVRGTFKHVDNEHKITNLKERWHLVAENTRDVTVFDLSTEGSGGIARME